MALDWDSVVIDCADIDRVARFWADLLQAEVQGPSNEGDVWIDLPGGPGLVFCEVPEPKTVKNRLHIDLRPDDQAAEVERALSLGARHVDVGQGTEVSWVVLADPEGNEFCILRALRPEERPQP